MDTDGLRNVAMRLGAITLLLATALLGCSVAPSRGVEYRVAAGENPGSLMAALDKAEAQWAAAEITSYSYRIRRGGVFGGTVYDTVFLPDSCRAKRLKDVGLPSSLDCDKNTMPELFATIRAELATGASDVSVSLDAKLGYVNSFWVEPNTDLTDQGWGAEISHLRILK